MLARPFYLCRLEHVMANKYLEKIASIMDGVRAIGRVARKGVAAYTDQVYKATGGVYINQAKKMGVTDIDELAKHSNPMKIKSLYRKQNPAAAGTFKTNASNRKAFVNNLRDLKKDQTDARIIAGGVTAGAVAGGVALKKKIDGPDVNTYSY